MTDETAADYDVIVVGCGPVGAAAANLLGHAGLSTLVLERDRSVVDVPRAIHFDGSIMRIFQSVGLADAIEAQCRVLKGMSTYGADGRLLSASGTGDCRDGWAEHYTFYQPVLEATLRRGLRRFSGVRLRLGATATEVDTSAPDSVAVTWVDNGRTHVARGRYLIAADGASSMVRKAFGITLEDLDFDEPWLVVDALVEGAHDLPEATSQMLCDPRRPTTVVPGPGNHRRWEFMLLPGEQPEYLSAPETIRGLLSKFVDVAATTIVRASVYRFHALIARSWQVGRVFLAGDAAHQTPPFLGQGMCHGIRDVHSLSWRLAMVLRDGAGAALLDSYEQERRPQVEAVIDQAVTKGREICVLDPEVAAARDRAVAAGSPWGKSLDSTLTLTVDSGLVHPSRPRRVLPMPQPRVQRPGSGSLLVDDLLPSGFAVLCADRGLADEAWPATGRSLPPLVMVNDFSDGGDAAGGVSRAGVTVTYDPSGWLRTWLDAAGGRAAILRPDRHAYAFASTADELRRAWHDLESVIGRAPARAPSP